MTNYRKLIFEKVGVFFNKTSVKVGMIVSILFLSLLIILNFIVLANSESSFVTVLEGIRYYPVQNPESGEIELKPEKYNILKFEADGSLRSKPLNEEFGDVFQKSLMKVGIVGVLSSFAIGFLVTYALTNPLLKLQKGLNKLRKNDYKVALEETGTFEIDEVVREFNRLTKELERVETLRKDLIADTSHELKTPLTSLFVQLEGIRDGLFQPENERIELLLEQVQRLDDLIERLQEFTRLRNKNQKLTTEKVPLMDFISQIIDKKRILLDEQGYSANLSIPENATIMAEKQLFERLISNLLENTCNYAHGNVISISYRESTLVYKDNGKGVPTTSLQYLFERFYRVEKSRNRKTGGLGLGLSIVREIVEAHGWTIDVKNDSGLTFTIHFG